METLANLSSYLWHRCSPVHDEPDPRADVHVQKEIPVAHPPPPLLPPLPGPHRSLSRPRLTDGLLLLYPPATKLFAPLSAPTAEIFFMSYCSLPIVCGVLLVSFYDLHPLRRVSRVEEPRRPHLPISSPLLPFLRSHHLFLSPLCNFHMKIFLWE